MPDYTTTTSRRWPESNRREPLCGRMPQPLGHSVTELPGWASNPQPSPQRGAARPIELPGISRDERSRTSAAASQTRCDCRFTTSRTLSTGQRRPMWTSSRHGEIRTRGGWVCRPCGAKIERVPSRRVGEALPAAGRRVADAGIVSIPRPAMPTRRRTRRGDAPESSMLQRACHGSEGRRAPASRARQFPTSAPSDRRQGTGAPMWRRRRRLAKRAWDCRFLLMARLRPRHHQ